MSSPYREQPRFLLCPRCGEMLDRVFAGVAACPACQGAWITQVILDAAFGNPRWPPGHSEWWRNALECPECALEGTKTTMDARSSEGVTVDCCPAHGVWLDRGELGQLIGATPGTEELAELQTRVTNSAPDPEELVRRRDAWRSELDVRRNAAAEFRAWFDAQQTRKGVAPRADDTAIRTKQAERRRLTDARDVACRDVQRLDADIAVVRAQLYRLQAEREAVWQTVRDLDDKLGAS